jgi:hypothetical protein
MATLSSTRPASPSTPLVLTKTWPQLLLQLRTLIALHPPSHSCSTDYW